MTPQAGHCTDETIFSEASRVNAWYDRSGDSPLSEADQLRELVERKITDLHIDKEFSESVNLMLASVLSEEACPQRRDLRDVPFFTIDCDHTQDMDDAVALRHTADGYELLVAIADVAAYATPGSELERVAFERGLSIYLPHQTIPMLPPVLSDDLCSLRPRAERKVIALIIDLTQEGEVRGYDLCKALIVSRLKGAYSEVNALLSGEAGTETVQKYALVASTVQEMSDLASALRSARLAAGAHVTDNVSSKPVITGDRIEFVLEERGLAQGIIEEFMVLANRLVAEFFVDHGLPVIYRVQEKRGRLAHYEVAECHHAELALKHYAHFTSPIRRLADLCVHQTLTAFLDGASVAQICECDTGRLHRAAAQATRRENRSDELYRACQNFCVKTVLSRHQDEDLAARVVGVNCHRHPIFLLQDFHLCVEGKADLHAKMGRVGIVRLGVYPGQGRGVQVESFRPEGTACNELCASAE